MMAHTPGPWKLDDDGFIQGVNRYGGCGSHECEWYSEEDKRLALSAPDLLAALEEIAEGDGCNCRVGPGCDWKCKEYCDGEPVLSLRLSGGCSVPVCLENVG